MNLLIFGFGVIVFLITVYGVVVTGGLFLTDRQLTEQPELLPEDRDIGDVDDALILRVRSLVRSEF